MKSLVPILLLALLSVCSVFSQDDGFTNNFDGGPIPDKWRSKVKVFLAWYQEYYGPDNYDCETNCTVLASDWGATPDLCTSDGKTIPNTFCAQFGSYVNCKSTYFKKTYPNPDEWSVVSPGPCGCPSQCSDRGRCESGRCHCMMGFTGDDCSLISCPKQKCSNHGVCSHVEGLGFETCQCQEGHTLGDCSAKMVELPPVPSLLNVSQYNMDYDDYGNDHPIFNESTIAQVHITVAPEDLAYLIKPSNQENRDYMHANFSFYNGALTEVFPNVGFRIKGGASRLFAKKSWKISFNTFEKGRSWGQQKKLSFKDSSMDVLYLREKASAAALYAMGAPAQRISHAMMYINNRLWGLYLIMEEPGSDQFLESRFGEKDGSLWKCAGGNLRYISDNPDDYRNSGYKAENDNAEADYSPIANLVAILDPNITPQDQFEEKIQEVFDVEFFLRTFAAEVATGNYDGIYNANNYFLYLKTDGIFSYYRHDLDLSFGFVEMNYKMATRNIWKWTTAFPPGYGFMLPMRILSVPSFQDLYASYLSILASYVRPGRGPFLDRVNLMHQEIKGAAAQDKWKSLDMGMYSDSEFAINMEHKVLRPNTLPPNNVINGTHYAAFISVVDFLEQREAATHQQILDGPPPKDEN